MSKNSIKKQLEALLKSAFFDYEIDSDGDFYIKDGLAFPFWISVVADDDLIKFFSFASFRDGENVDELKSLQLSNRINAGVKSVSTSVIYGKLYDFVYYSTGKSFDAAEFVAFMRRTSEAFKFAVGKFDEDDLIY